MLFPPLVLHNNNFDSDRRINSGETSKTTWYTKIQSRIKIV